MFAKTKLLFNVVNTNNKIYRANQFNTKNTYNSRHTANIPQLVTMCSTFQHFLFARSENSTIRKLPPPQSAFNAGRWHHHHHLRVAMLTFGGWQQHDLLAAMWKTARGSGNCGEDKFNFFLCTFLWVCVLTLSQRVTERERETESEGISSLSHPQLACLTCLRWHNQGPAGERRRLSAVEKLAALELCANSWDRALGWW